MKGTVPPKGVVGFFYGIFALATFPLCVVVIWWIEGRLVRPSTVGYAAFDGFFYALLGFIIAIPIWIGVVVVIYKRWRKSMEQYVH